MELSVIDAVVSRGNVLKELCIFGLFEVLQIREIGHEVRLVEPLLYGQVIEIGGIGKALYELGHG
jgi:hypothetical protein